MSHCKTGMKKIKLGITMAFTYGPQNFNLSSTHSDSSLLELLKDGSDGNREGQRELAAPLHRVIGCNDADVRFPWIWLVLAVVVLQQVLQITSQQDGLLPQILHGGFGKDLIKIIKTQIQTKNIVRNLWKKSIIARKIVGIVVGHQPWHRFL